MQFIRPPVRPSTIVHQFWSLIILVALLTTTLLANVGITAAQSAPLVNSLQVSDIANSGDWSVRTNLQVGDTAYGDRTNTVVQLPNGTQGALWIRPANDSKAATNKPLVSFALAQAADVSVAVDARIGRPGWIDSTWTDRNAALTVRDTFTNPPTDRPLKLFTKRFVAGTVTLGPNALNDSLMYIVLVQPTPAQPTAVPTAQPTAAPTAAPPAPNGNFSIRNGRFYDPNGKEYIPIGWNMVGSDSTWPYNTLPMTDPKVVETWNFNFVRLINSDPKVTYAGKNIIRSTVNNDSDGIGPKRAIVEGFTSKKIVVMLDNHNFTGRYPNDADLETVAQWWVKVAKKWKNNPYVWFNLSNEPANYPGLGPDTRWVKLHQRLVRAVREEAGAQNMIIIDGSDWAEDANSYRDEFVEVQDSAILSYGDQVKSFNGKTYNNIGFAIHMYAMWACRSDDKLQRYIDDVRAKGYPLLVGEYGAATDPNKSCGASHLDSTKRFFRVALRQNGVGGSAWHATPGDSNIFVSGVPKDVGIRGVKFDAQGNPTNLTEGGKLMWDATHGGGFGLK